MAIKNLHGNFAMPKDRGMQEFPEAALGTESDKSALTRAFFFLRKNMGRRGMTFRLEGDHTVHVNGLAEPEHLAMLTSVLDEYCQARGIESDSLERETLAARLMTLFANGMIRLEDLKQALRDRD